MLTFHDAYWNIHEKKDNGETVIKQFTFTNAIAAMKGKRIVLRASRRVVFLTKSKRMGKVSIRK